jgi:hypothetical protein
VALAISKLDLLWFVKFSLKRPNLSTAARLSDVQQLFGRRTQLLQVTKYQRKTKAVTV